MTIKEVSQQYRISADTLRYYEKVGIIPRIGRTAGGIRDYTEEDLKWVQNAICLRSVGLSIELLAEYVRLYQQGNASFQARCDLLKQARQGLLEEKRKYDEALQRLDHKIERYEEALKTGELLWNQENSG